PADFRMTLNSVCSSTTAAATAGPAAATGAAAETPNLSSMAFTSSITSIRVLPAIASTICSLERDIVFTSGKCFRIEAIRSSVSGRLGLGFGGDFLATTLLVGHGL